jgi:hypothetical protein
MAVTLANLTSNLNTYFGDATEDRISNAERYQALTEATVWLLEELGNDHNIKTYDVNFFDTINYYRISSSVSDLLASADLRRAVDAQTITANHKSSKEMAEAIGKGSREFSWAVERRDGDSFLAITLSTNKRANVVENFDVLGTWEVDSTTSDATNISIDSNEFLEGNASIRFDVDVSQSGNNRATILNSAVGTQDLTINEDIGSWLLEAYIPDALTVTSYTLYWGSDSTNYWSATITTDIDGSTLADGWNTLKFDWVNASETGTPDITAIEYVAIQLNYSAGQVDDTAFRYDNLRIANPEKLKYHYLSWDLGTTSVGADLTAYTAATDIPFYSGQYDQYKYAVAHKAAAILFFSVRLRDEALIEEREAIAAVKRLESLFPKSKTPESNSFKVSGLNFNRNRRRVRFT